MKRRAKIVATIGPASNSLKALRQLVAEGMDVARLNFSHGTHRDHALAIKRIRHVASEYGRAIGIMQDLQGPKIRTGPLAGRQPLRLHPGQRLTLTASPVPSSEKVIYVDFPDLAKAVSPGDTILMDDGQLVFNVLKLSKKGVLVEVIQGGLLGAHKGVSLPGGRISPNALTEKDLRDLTFGLQHGVDICAISFVRSASDIHALQQAIAERAPDRRAPMIIAKLERPEVLEVLPSVLAASDGVMVARGDLGVEISSARVPSLQKQIIRQANQELRTVITATQMLESMIFSPRPTRAEASDVANAVFDGSDALMLSGETAAGSYPVESVRTMHHIILDAESHSAEWGVQLPECSDALLDDAVATTHAARALARDRDVAAIAVFTRTGRTARLMAKARPTVPILGFTPEEETYDQMSLLWGVAPYIVPKANTVEEMIQRVEETGTQAGIFKPGDQVVLVASLPVGAMGPPNFTLLHTIGSQRNDFQIDKEESTP
jgi:pyruvate kinase